MTVTATTTVRLREFPGFVDASLPVGTWAISALALGDASGGERVIVLEFNPSTAPRSTLYYSLEQFSVNDARNGALAATLRTVNMDPVPGLGAIALTQFWSADTLAAESAGDSTLNPDSFASFRKLWLGRQALNGVAASLNYRIGNSDLDILTVTAQGYYWDQTSLNAEGGPSRPAQGMYA